MVISPSNSRGRWSSAPQDQKGTVWIEWQRLSYDGSGVVDVEYQPCPPFAERARRDNEEEQTNWQPINSPGITETCMSWHATGKKAEEEKRLQTAADSSKGQIQPKHFRKKNQARRPRSISIHPSEGCPKSSVP